MISKSTCPVCNYHLKENQVKTCPHCKTDLGLWNQAHELPNFYYNQALQSIKENRLSDAKEKLIAALVLYPQHPEAQILLGKIYAELELYNEAVAVWEKALTPKPQNSLEIENLIEAAKKRREQKQKPLPPPSILEKTSKHTIRWIAVSALVVIAAFILGWLLSIRQPSTEPPPKPPGIAAQPPDCTQKVKEILKGLGKDEFQVQQKDSVISLQGEVVIPQEKYEIETLLQNQNIEGISAIDLSGVTVQHPGGYYYMTREGDNLWKIAYKIWGNGKMFDRIYEVNKPKIPDPAKIPGGITLLIPGKEPRL